MTLWGDSAEHYCCSLQRFTPELRNNLGDIWQFDDLLAQVGLKTTVIFCMDPFQHLFQVEQVVVVVVAILVGLIFLPKQEMVIMFYISAQLKMHLAFWVDLNFNRFCYCYCLKRCHRTRIHPKVEIKGILVLEIHVWFHSNKAGSKIPHVLSIINHAYHWFTAGAKKPVMTVPKITWKLAVSSNWSQCFWYNWTIVPKDLDLPLLKNKLRCFSFKSMWAQKNVKQRQHFPSDWEALT